MSAAPDVDYDIVIVGGGLVGASLAIALGATRWRVALVEGTAPASGAAQPSFDDRTTALGNSTRQIFETLGVWAGVAAEAAEIRRIHVSDAGRFGFARLDAAEQGVDAFGYVVTNRVLGRALQARLLETAQVQRFMPASVTAARVQADVVELDVRSGGEVQTLRARLAVAADGARSLLRAAAGLGADVEDYAQVALTAHVEATRAPDGTAYERFTPTGPVALLPLASGAFGAVWILDPAAAERALQSPDAAFLQDFQACFGWRVGQFTRVGRRAAYPLALSRAADVTAVRTALIGNAAQALHPIAGQGFNLGLRDAALLAEALANHAGDDVGVPAVLQAFAASRAVDRDGVTRFTDGLVKLFRDDRPGIPALRNAGLLAFDLLPPAKAALARVSWGFGGATPRLARGLPIIDPAVAQVPR